MWSTGDSSGYLLVLLCPVIKVNEKLQKPNLGRMMEGIDPLGMKVWLNPSGKEPGSSEMLCESRENMEWILEEGFKDQQMPHN